MRLLRSTHCLPGFFGGPHRVGHVAEVHQGGGVAVAVGFADQGVEFVELDLAGADGGAGLLVEGGAVSLDGLGDQVGGWLGMVSSTSTLS